MTSAYNKITQGETMLLSVTPKDEDGEPYPLNTGTWVCTVAVYDVDGKEYAKTTAFTVSTDGKSFEGYFEPTDTNSFIPTNGDDIPDLIVAEMVERTDSTPVLTIMEKKALRVEARIIPAT